MAEPKPVARAAVIGAGVMGAGIAQWLSARHLPVILRDINAEQIARGMGNIAKIYRDGVKRQVFTPLEAREGLDRIYPAPAEVPLRHTDLVIEAAVENLELKKKIFQRPRRTGRPGHDSGDQYFGVAHFGTGRQHAPSGTRGRPAFFQSGSPDATGRNHRRAADRRRRFCNARCKFAQQIGKLPVVVKDSPGFLVNRILMPYLIEAGNLFEAGAQR